ncbi:MULTISPECIES: hydantoinase/oxoprolinase family protein [unclassified Microbacterium]|uniref:hydantoinase/oxoprolinase family protein n=1 Tax=unclassified Microbacterium TaxID=2609290 RepID=UPI000C2CC6EA|nr:MULTISPECIES: hydantoinase/oxoprolinase family protein [unclassified Microbacterium]
MSRHVIAVDIGGTHTDAALLTADGRLHVRKVRSTPADPGVAMVTAVEALVDAAAIRLDEVAAVVHGTTVATNAVIEGDFARVGLVVTEGFEDILDIGTQQRPDLYDPWRAKGTGIVPRDRVYGVRERTGADGAVVDPLDEDGVRRIAGELLGTVDAVAIVFLFSFADPTHERRAAEILRDALPGIPVTLSSAVAPEFREYPRAATTVLNAALLPRTGGYIARLDDRLRSLGFGGAFQLMTSSGGVIPASVARDLPVSLLVSGPAAGAVAAAELGRRLGIDDLVMLDVGGTSADVALVQAGALRRRYRGDVAGMPVALPQIDVLPIGAGGGSIARADAYGSLAVGPESAGADPGPAAYGTGERATVTDAHLVLGSLDPAGLLGGALPLDPERARTAIGIDVAEPLGIDVETAAGALIRIANGRMAEALRMVTVVRGVDVRSCALMAFGGAGPLHAVAIADELDITRVVVPRYPGLTSALGLLMGDARYELGRTFVAPLRGLDHDRVDALIRELAAEAAAALGVDDASTGDAGPTISLDLDLRYAGQAYELTVPVADAAAFHAADVDRVEESFHVAHDAMYGHSWRGASVELVTIRVRAGLPRIAVDWQGSDDRGDGSKRERAGRDAAGAEVAYAVVDRAGVAEGMRGPAIVTQVDTTTLIPAGWYVERTSGVAMVLTNMVLAKEA